MFDRGQEAPVKALYSPGAGQLPAPPPITFLYLEGFQTFRSQPVRVWRSPPQKLRGDFSGACDSRKKEKEEKRMKTMNKTREEAGDLF